LYVEGFIGCVLFIGELITCVLIVGELIVCFLVVVAMGVVIRVWHCGEKLVFFVFCGNLLLFGTAVCFGHGSKQASKKGRKEEVEGWPKISLAWRQIQKGWSLVMYGTV